MAMNDEETVALIAGGHTFGKAHGAAKRRLLCRRLSPPLQAFEQQGFGWENKCGTGKGADTITSGLEGAWTSNPVAWTTQYLDNLFAFEVGADPQPGRCHPVGAEECRRADRSCPDAHDPTKRHAPIMFTTDLSLKFDPAYRKISKRFLENPDEFARAFAMAWFKLTHRDMGPRARYVSNDLPEADLLWQDPVPAAEYKLINERDVSKLKQAIADSGLSNTALVRTAWASAASYRSTDMRGGANGARVRLAPQKDWSVNDPAELAAAIATLEQVQKSFNRRQRRRQASVPGRCDRAGWRARPLSSARHRLRDTTCWCRLPRDARMPTSPRPMWRHLPCWNRGRTGSATTSPWQAIARRRPCWSIARPNLI